MRIDVVDLRFPLKDGWHRVNVSRRLDGMADTFLPDLGNPYHSRTGATHGKYRAYLTTDPRARAALNQLRTIADQVDQLELGCWCGGHLRCHANVLRNLLLERPNQLSTVDSPAQNQHSTRGST